MNKQVVFKAKKQVELTDTNIPEPLDGEVLIKTEVSQISTGTELTMLEANVSADSDWNEDIAYPFFPGYSNVGTVIKAGKKVNPSIVGKRVFSAGKHAAYVCQPAETIDGAGSFSCSKEDFLKNPTCNVSAIPDSVDSDEAVFGSLGCIAMASIRLAEIRPGDCVVVFGLGLVGQMLVRLAKVAGASTIIAADVSDNRLGMVPNEKCFIRVNSRTESVAEAIKAHNNDRLARIVFEATSVPGLIAEQVKCLDVLGKLIISSSPKGTSVIDFDYCSRKGLAIIGAHNITTHTHVETARDPWTRNMDIQYFFELLDKNLISVKELITHREPYKNAPELYNMLMEDRTLAMAVHLYWNYGDKI